MPGPQAKEFYNAWMKRIRKSTPLRIQESRFAASMNVHLVNDGPVTIMIETKGGERRES
jgi:D-Tyr-tRNAtyr deacylase